MISGKLSGKKYSDALDYYMAKWKAEHKWVYSCCWLIPAIYILVLAHSVFLSLTFKIRDY